MGRQPWSSRLTCEECNSLSVALVFSDCRWGTASQLIGLMFGLGNELKHWQRSHGDQMSNGF
jgi:hypothetical protein